MDTIGDFVARALEVRESADDLARINKEVGEFTAAFPLYARRLDAASV
jgi:glycine/serine hydroxymethyltransferase